MLWLKKCQVRAGFFSAKNYTDQSSQSRLSPAGAPADIQNALVVSDFTFSDIAILHTKYNPPTQ